MPADVVEKREAFDNESRTDVCKWIGVLAEDGAVVFEHGHDLLRLVRVSSYTVGLVADLDRLVAKCVIIDAIADLARKAKKR